METRYCLQYRIWIKRLYPCHPRCKYFVRGEGGNFKEVEENKFDIECIYFTRRISKTGIPVYYCTLYDQEMPLCNSCLFQKDKYDE